MCAAPGQAPLPADRSCHPRGQDRGQEPPSFRGPGLGQASRSSAPTAGSRPEGVEGWRRWRGWPPKGRQAAVPGNSLGGRGRGLERAALPGRPRPILQAKQGPVGLPRRGVPQPYRRPPVSLPVPPMASRDLYHVSLVSRPSVSPALYRTGPPLRPEQGAARRPLLSRTRRRRGDPKETGGQRVLRAAARGPAGSSPSLDLQPRSGHLVVPCRMPRGGSPQDGLPGAWWLGRSEPAGRGVKGAALPGEPARQLPGIRRTPRSRGP